MKALIQLLDLAVAERLGERQAGAGEKGFGVFLQASLGRDGENERVAHDALPFLPACTSASTQIEKPTAGIGVTEPSCVIKPS